jgi:uncharacterized protein YigA (DUF484 family)
MTYKLVYGAVREHPRKVIHVLRLVDDLLETEELDELAERMREGALTKNGEPDAVVVVQGDSKDTLRLYGEASAVARVRTAMFNAAISWREFELDLG